MFDEKDIEMSDAPIDMPPLDHNPSEPAVEQASQLPPELQQAQEYERQMEELAQGPQKAPEPALPLNTPPVQTQAQQDQEALQSRNFKALKEAAERAARERDELARKLEEYENAKLESSYEDFNIKEEDIVEGKHLSQAIKRIKHLEQQQRQYMKQTAEQTAEMRLRSQYPDFDKVMTLENVQMLSASYPELAKSINASTDLYDKAASAYTIIKKFGIYNDAPHEADKQKAVANSSKPRPLASVGSQKGDSPISRANAFAGGLTEELKAQLRKEMDEYSKLY